MFLHADRRKERSARFEADGREALTQSPDAAPARVFAPRGGQSAYVAGTFDTKARELLFLRDSIAQTGLKVVTVDLSTSAAPRSGAEIQPGEVAAHHPNGATAVFTWDRGSAVSAMAQAFEAFIATRRDLAGIISAGGSGATALATPAMRRLPVGVPKVMVSTVASGDVRAYVGPADICMIYSVTDVSGLNRISTTVLANAAHALAGMIGLRRESPAATKPAIGLSMFGVTTLCVQAVARALEDDYDCLVFHATGTGGQSMEKLVDSHLLAGVIDVTTTEIADHLMGGIMSAGEERLEAIIRSKLPYVGSCGALDMVNFASLDRVPAHYAARNLYAHNPQVTLMRTSARENRLMGAWIAAKLNRMDGPVRFFLPLGGVSAIDAPGKPFCDPEADKALFETIRGQFVATPDRRLIVSPCAINDPAFAASLVEAFREIIRR
jgi:uncharacterized protein (UPF0261 family)